MSPVFAGREAELAVVAGVFEDAIGGTPGVVLVGAEAGGGKSRLASEFAARVQDRALVLAGACVELSAAGLPYAPFTAALRQLVRERGAAEVSALLGGQGTGELAVLLPEFGAPTVGPDPDMARGRLFEVLLTLFEILAGRLPLVLIVEDMHWADRSTRDLLSFLVRNLRRAAVLLVVTFRSDELHRTHPLRPLLSELSRMERVTRLELPRLSREQVAAQLEGILGRAPESAVTAAVYERGGGVPLFTEALLTPGGAVSPELPWSLRDLLLAAVKDLPEQTQEVLRAAAVGGGRVGHELLAMVTGFDHAALAASLRPAVAANVMVADEDGYMFRHELIGEAVREDLLPGERAAAERAFAEALEAGAPAGAGGMVSVQLALHWRGAHEHDRALRAAWEAAAEAATGLVFGVKLQMLEQVLELWARVPKAAEYTGTDRAGVIELGADAARWAGEPVRGLALVEAAFDELGEDHEPGRLASLLLLRASLRQQGLLPGRVDDLQAALRLARAPTPLRAQILGQLARALMLLNRDDEAKRPAEEMRALGERLGDEECQSEALITLAQLGNRKGDDTIAVFQGACETARRIGSARLELRAYIEITHALEGRGEHERAILASREGLARARQLGLTRYGGAALAPNLAESLTSVGRWDEALEVIEEALALDPPPFGRALLLLLRGQIAVARGEQETAARTVHALGSVHAAALTESQVELPVTRLTTQFRLAQGDLTGALAAARVIPEQYLDAEPRYLWPLLVTAMRVCADVSTVAVPHEVGDPAKLRGVLERRAVSLAQAGAVQQAHAAVFTAEASRAAGYLDFAAWDAAAAAWDALGQPYPLAYALLRAAGAAAATGNRDAAATRLSRAAEVAGPLRAGPLLQQISQLARRARVEITGGSRAPGAAPFGLSARELEVLRLVAAGRGNREIAAELFISPKTASVHVSNILGKLGVASRGEAAATAHRLHLFDT